MRDLTEKEIEKLNHGRLLRSEASVVLPIIAKRKEGALGRLIAYFKGGQENMLLPTVAELSALSDLEIEMNRGLKEVEQLERHIYGTPI